MKDKPTYNQLEIELKKLKEFNSDLILKNQELIANKTKLSGLPNQNTSNSELIDNELLFDVLMKMIPGRMYFKNRKSQFIKISDSLAKWHGFENSEIAIGKTDFDLFAKEYAQQTFEEEEQIMNSGVPLKNFEEKEIWKDGRITWASTSKMPIIDKNGNCLGLSGISRDITDLKKTQIALKESEEKARIALNTTKDSILLCSTKGVVYDCNDTFCRVIKLSKEDIIGKNHLKWFSPEVEEFKLQTLKKVTKTKQTIELIDEGHEIIFHTTLSPILDDEGNVSQIVIYARDITEKTIADRALKDSELKLKEANSAKDKFFSIIAHDLKNPFNSMLGFSDLLINNYDKYDTAKQKKHISIIHQGIQSTYKLLENLLLWSRTQQGKIDFVPKNENLHLLTFEAVSVLDQQSKNKSITIENNISKDVVVKADKNMTSTILRNLISNAIKFSKKNSVIKVISKLSSSKNFVEISIKDNGIGISPEVQSKLFLISENTSTKGTENESGTGLGLILCKEFIKRHGGEIWIKSEAGTGSEFIFSLPYVN